MKNVSPLLKTILFFKKLERKSSHFEKTRRAEQEKEKKKKKRQRHAQTTNPPARTARNANANTNTKHDFPVWGR